MLASIGAKLWYLDGIYTPGQQFVEIAEAYHAARTMLENRSLDAENLATLDEKVKANQPINRELSTNFFLYEADKVK